MSMSDKIEGDLHDALGLLQVGEWEAAHLIVQKDESDLGSWMHAIVHLQEGDVDNAHYWYRRARRDAQGIDDIASELLAVACVLGSK